MLLRERLEALLLAIVILLTAGGAGGALAAGGTPPADATEDGGARERSASPGAPGTRASTVILISLDGTRPADVRADRLPSLVALGEAGARADALRPVYPTNTFPNHVSLATGVTPLVHRLVNNAFEDPVRGRFSRREPHAWIEAEPIWSVAERHGVRTAAYYWVGSEGPWRGGPGPSETYRFSSRTLEKTKVDRILSWLAAPEGERPRLIVAWFHGADHAGHEAGPESEAVTRALAVQDVQIARLVQGLETRGLFPTTTLIFVSDHGMTTAERRIDLRRILRAAGLRPRIFGIGGFATVRFGPTRRTPERLDRAVEVIREAGLAAHRRERAPADWGVADERFGDIVVRAPIGTAIVGRNPDLEGFHGYSAEAPEMAGLLVARGRGVTPGTRLGRVDALAIAPTVLRLLDLPVPDTMEKPAIEALLVGVEAGAAAGNDGEMGR